ncbi:hypothetical protein AXF42_Ash019306 [Apostasia shenzhenica]|uniref:Retrotransposon gag domain-containing protein n=1 Tax=Apostasia shenzhenica TaxID=1088818 RepID=A0A2I0ARA7_9ASPA|nr:hypothetical protein AXF42_Ash019306 [Apostasia shenzhenica]
MLARTRKTNSAARSVHAGEPSVRAPNDRASASTSRRHAESASSSRGTRVSELQGMLANLTDLVTGLTAQQADTTGVCNTPPPIGGGGPCSSSTGRSSSGASSAGRGGPRVLPAGSGGPGSPSSGCWGSSPGAPGSSNLRPNVWFFNTAQTPFSPPGSSPEFPSTMSITTACFPSTCFPSFSRQKGLHFPDAQAPHHGPDPFFGSMDGNTPFFDAIRLAPIPEDFRPPRLEVYRGATDPREHVQGFEAAVRYRQPDEAIDATLANTLKRAAFTWFIKLPKGHISSYEHLKWELIARFIGRTRMVVSDMVLANIKQGERKSLWDYTNRFFVVVAEAEDVDPAVAMHNYRRGLKAGDLSKSL